MSSDKTGGTDRDLRSLASVSQGAGLFLAGNGVSRVFAFLLNIILTRLLGTRLYGFYSYSRVVFSLVKVFTRLGSDKSVQRYLPEYEDDPPKQYAVLALAYGTSLVASVVVAALVYYLAPVISGYTLSDPLFTDVLRIVAIVLPFNTLVNVTLSVFKSIERMDFNVVVSSGVEPLTRLVFVGGAVLLGYSLVGAAAGLVVSGTLTALVAVAVLYRRTNLNSVGVPRKGMVKEYYNYSVPLTFNQLGNFLYNRVDILMVGYFLSGSAVGVYNIAVLVSSLLSLPLTAFNQLFPPIASRLYHSGEFDELESMYSTVTRWTFTISLFPGIAALLYAEEVLRVFGEGFTEGRLVLVFFVVAQLTNCVVGPSGLLLMMSDHQYLTLFNQLSSGALNALLNYVFITEYGFVGAAVATATVLSLINVLRVIEVWYLEGIMPYDRSYLKPIAAGVAAGVVLFSLSTVLSGYALLVFGGACGAIAFALSLYAFGIEDTDVELVNGVLSCSVDVTIDR
jgi:O-antigen/teichoic acid export membrane protein